MTETVMWIIIALCVGVFVGINIHKFLKKDKMEKIEAVSTWLLYAVCIAEQKWGAGTGKMKLAEVYDMFLTKFPNLMTLIPYSKFVELVDTALENMRKLLSTNKTVSEIIEGAKPETPAEAETMGDAEKGE